MPARKEPPLVDPDLILNPAWRQFFGKTTGDHITMYKLLIRHTYNIIYADEIREANKTQYEKDKKKRALPGKKKVRLREWRIKFSKSLTDKVKYSRMLQIANRPREGEAPESEIIHLTNKGMQEIERIRADSETRYTNRVVARLEENMDELFTEYQKEQEGRV